MNVALLQLDAESRSKLFSRVDRNIKMNEHILNQQKQILKFVTQHTELFYSAGDFIFKNIWSFLIRYFERIEVDLRIEAISTLTAFSMRRQQTPGYKVDPDKQRQINSQLLILAIRLCCDKKNDVVKLKSILELVKCVLKLEPHQMTALPVHILNNIEKPQEKESTYSLLIHIFVICLPYFKEAYIEENLKFLRQCTDFMFGILEEPLAFSTMIYLLPELFAASSSKSTEVQSFLTSLKDSLFTVYKNDEALLQKQNQGKNIRIYHVLYLIQCIVERTPSALPRFLGDLMICFGNLLKFSQSVFSNYFSPRFGQVEQNEICSRFV